MQPNFYHFEWTFVPCLHNFIPIYLNYILVSSCSEVFLLQKTLEIKVLNLLCEGFFMISFFPCKPLNVFSPPPNSGHFTFHLSDSI